jgi:PHS family inorganic phosphate transporter-like MFS transporter
VNGSLSILGGLIVYRLILGLGIGVDYPLSAVIYSELAFQCYSLIDLDANRIRFAPTINRACMLSSVFFFQPLGQLAATLVALVVTASFKSSLTAGFKSNTGESLSGALYTFNCYQDQYCFRTVDIMWRIIIGLGAVPPVLALWFRLVILESPRYTADVLNENVQAYRQIHFMGRLSWITGRQVMQQILVQYLHHIQTAWQWLRHGSVRLRQSPIRHA